MGFTYQTFGVEIARDVDLDALGWPEPGDATTDGGLGCNREYLDLRRLSWREAKRVFVLEGELMARLELAADVAEECGRIDEELYEADGDHLYGLDIGVASTVVSLSAAKCVPCSSCNAGVFGDRHLEAYPLVAFFARRPALEIITRAASNAGIGLHNGAGGCVVAYADDIRNMRCFAGELIRNAPAFNAIKIRAMHPRKSIAPSEQENLPF